MSSHRLLGAVLGAALSLATAGAHHAISLDYDTDRTGTVEGVVDEVFWANPHVHYYLTVTGDDGSTELWDLEAPNVSVMTRRGIARDSVRVGDRITVTGTLGRDGARRILARTIVKADGTRVMGDEEYGE